MHPSDKVMIILVLSAACCFVLPLAPESARDWVFYGPGRWLVPIGIAAMMGWTVLGKK